MKLSKASLLAKCGAFLIALALAANVASAKSEKEYSESFPLESNGEVRIENINGSINVIGWDRDEVSVVAIKKGKNQDIVDGIQIIIDSDEGSFSLETKLPKEKKWFWFFGDTQGNVSYEIKVPVGAFLRNVSSVNGAVRIEGIEGKVKASTVNGSLKALGLKGDVTLSTVNGSVAATYNEVPLANSISMEVVNGSVKLELPRDTNAHFKANTVNGGINSGFGLKVEKHFPIGASINAQLGEGGTDIKLSSVNGRISIKKS